ncbi:MAG: DUF4160 domain-containing protein [Lachnospiraceae bacterium]|nr:DUF4160 domain-containing protein [Lachnospiraceae bacterium]
MPKYFPFKISGYYLYFTSHCTLECMHVHASNEELVEGGSAKFFVRSNGDTELTNRGNLQDKDIRIIQKFIKENFESMYITWRTMSKKGFFGEDNE